MRIDAQNMITCLIVLVFISFLTSGASCQRPHIRRKRLQSYDSRSFDSYGGVREGGGGGDGFRGGGGGEGGGGNDGGGEEGGDKKPFDKNAAKCGQHQGAKQRASGIAVQAAKEATKANEDMASAVRVASTKIKNEFADKATAAAKAAEAVLVGKGQVLEQLEAEVHEGEQVVQEETQELATAEANNMLAAKANSQGQQELKMLTVSLKLAKDKLETSEQVSTVWAQSLADKSALLEAAQRRVGVLMRQLIDARNDFEKTKKAAHNAARAAHEAKQRIEPVERLGDHEECSRSRT